MIKLTIRTRKHLLLEHDCLEVTLPGENGEVQILENHANIMLLLKNGRVMYDGASILIEKGFAHVSANAVSILCQEKEDVPLY